MPIHRHAPAPGKVRFAPDVRDIVALLENSLTAMPHDDRHGKDARGGEAGRDDADERVTQAGQGPVLVVDDDGDIRESLMEAFEEHGYRVLGARDGEDAFAKIRQAPVPPCLIVLDLMMPNMDGWTFREEQRRRPELAVIPVVVMSANRDVVADRSSQDLEPVACLEKPLDVGTLLRIVQEHCAPHDPPVTEDSGDDSTRD
jgi:CheY-like chemotaxis protein